MAVIHLDAPVALGALSDALRPAVALTVDAAPRESSSSLLQAGAVRAVVVETSRPTGVDALRACIDDAITRGGDAVVLTDAPLALLIEGGFALPVLALRAGTAEEWVRERVGTLDDDADRRMLTEEHSRRGIVEIADQAAAELNGHLIVEDDAFQLLAHSRMIDGADAARRAAVLQRQLPGPYQQIFNTQGVLARLIAGEDVIRTDPVPAAGLGQRLIAGIRQHGRLLGSIWLAREAPAFDDADADVLRRAAFEMSALLAALIRGRDDDRSRREEAVRSLLDGQELANPLSSLGHGAPDVGRASHVIAMAEVADPTARHRIEADGIRVLAEVTARSGRAAVLAAANDDLALMMHFGCEEDASQCTAASSRALAERVAESFAGMGAAVAVTVGRHATSAAAIRQSREDAEEMLAALRARGRCGLATLDELWASMAVRAVLPRAPFDLALPPPIRHLLGTARGSASQRRVLRIILDHWGDVAATATELGVHPNTVRYRLQRLRETLGVDLRDPDTRLALWMLLRSEP